MKWFVDVDIVGFFDNIDHDILLDLLRKRIDDEKFIDLIGRMLKAGFMEDWKHNPTYSGTPQGGVVSPILANIYLHELDEFMATVQTGFDKGKQRAAPPEYWRLTGRIQHRWRRIHRLKAEGRGDDPAIRRPFLYLPSARPPRDSLPSLYPFRLNYRRLRRAAENPAGPQGYDYTMMTLVACDDPGLVILPTHRVVHRLRPDAIASFAAEARRAFEVEEVAAPDALIARLREHGRGALAVALKGHAHPYLLRLRDKAAVESALPGVAPAVRELDVSVLHATVCARISQRTGRRRRSSASVLLAPNWRWVRSLVPRNESPRCAMPRRTLSPRCGPG